MRLRLLFLAIFSVLACTSAVAKKTQTARDLDYLNRKFYQSQLDEKKVNLRISFPGILMGWSAFEADLKITPAITLGPTFEYLTLGGNKGYSLGLSANYALNGDVFSKGWLVNPYVAYYKSNWSESSKTSESATGIVGTLLSYQWIWNNGFNIQLGGGLAYYTAIRVPGGTAGISNIHPQLGLTMGYAF